MEENQKRDVGRALTTDEIRLQAHKWNLAGDVGLLAHLENFSQSLINKSRETQKNLNNLLDSFEDTSTTINNVTNQFLALQNSQFVENRVYDDESPSEEPKSDNKVSQEEQESYFLARYKEAVEIGVKLLDTHFEEVQLPLNSDSDEEEVSIENSGLVWKPKNPYAGKRFPLLIGSAEWWADDNVGLGEYEENVNRDTPSSEPESDIEAEVTAEKRIRMSSSSSSESEKLVSKKPKGENPEFDDIFAPPVKGMFGVESNLFKQGDDDDIVSKHQIVPRSRENIKPLNLPKVLSDDEHKLTNSVPTKSKNSIFDDDENGNSEEEYRPEPTPENKQNRLQNALTEELTAKLTSVSNTKEDRPKPAKRDIFRTDNNEQSALFAENDDNDDLFSAKNPASNFLFKKQSIFSDGDPDDELFGNSGNLFAGNKPKISVKISEDQTSNGNPGKDNKTPNLFDDPGKFSEDDLFGNNDDYLFTGKSVLSSSRNSGVAGPGWKGSREVKFSTPTEQQDNQEVPQGDIFGSVSEIRSNGSSNVASVSGISNDMDNSFNFSRYSSVDTSKDDGFVEPSDASYSKSVKLDSSGLFEPRLTSTRQVSSDTSDYKTQGISTRASQSNSGTPDLEENSKSKMGHTEKIHFPRNQSDPNKSKSLFEEEEEGDDLFQASKPTKQVKENSLFDDEEIDDLFSNLPPKEKNQPIFDEKQDNSIFSHKSSVPPLDGDEEEKSSLLDKVKQDSVSMSSSRSSLFDDINVGGKTNLASVFETDKSAKNNDDLFGKTGDDLFGEKKVVPFDDNDVNDLFGDGAVSKPKVNGKDNMSLFDNLEDADDLFGDNVSKKLFGNYDDDGDLFGKTSGKDNVKETSGKPAHVSKSEASPDGKAKPAHAISDKTDNLFDNAGTLERPTKSAVTSIFGDFEDEDEDLFRKSNTKVTKTIDEGFNLKQGDSDEDIFRVSTKENISKDTAVKDDKKVHVDHELFVEPKFSQNVGKSVKNDSGTSDKEKNSKVEKKDLFEDRTLMSKVAENKKLFDVDDSDDNNLFNSESTEKSRLSIDNSESGARPSPPATLNIAMGLDLSGKQKSNVSEVDGSVMSSEKPKVIGKLNIPTNLKINPMSLLPGAVMKKTAPVEDTTGVENDGGDEGCKDDTKPAEVAPSLLKCLSKDRVKIQTRRRPQTRRARQEALRSSGIDFHVSNHEVAAGAARSRSVDDFEKGEKLTSKSKSDTNVSGDSGAKVLENVDSSNSVFHSIENSPEPLFSSPLMSNPISPSTDEEDYFNVPELDTNFEREDQSIFKKDVTDITNDDTLLFDGAPVLSPTNPMKNLIAKAEEKPPVKNKTDTVTPGRVIKSRIIIDDEDDGKDDDDGLFTTKTRRNTPQKADVKSRTSNIFDDLGTWDDESDSLLFQKKTNDVRDGNVPKKSLFDENDEANDLFSDKPVAISSITKTENDSTVKTKVNKVNVVEKSKETFVDPLGLMSNPD